jgi:hypothetical protein
MTESTRRHGGTNALACQVTIYRRESYVAVKFILKNVREEPVTVTYRQTVPDDLARDHLSFTASYMGDAWSVEDATLEFSTDIDPGEQIETVYGIKRVDIPALVNFINYGTIVVTQGETTVETLTDIDPDIEGDPEETAQTNTEESADEPSVDEESETEPSESESSTGDSSQTNVSVDDARTGTEPDEGGDDSQDDAGDATDERSVAADADDTTESDDGESIQWVTPTTADTSVTGDSPATTAEESEAGDHIDGPDTTTGTTTEADHPEGATTKADDGPERETATGGPADGEGAHVPFSDVGDDDTERAPALPANPEDYILEDVRGEIESSAEFEWVELAVDATEEADDSGVLGWVRSRLPF